MRIAAVTKARTLGFIEIDELNRNGRIRLADVVPALAKRYGFLTYPTKLEDFDVNDKGMVFGSGRLSDIVINELKIYSGAVYVETLSSTDDSRTVLLDMLDWGAKELEFTYTEGMIKRWAYVSDVTFYSDFPLLRSLSSPLDKLARKTGDQVSEIFGEDIPYHPMNFVVGHDPRIRKHGIAGFTVQQRVNTKFDENKYFSEAPLPTSVHLQFLAELEEDTKNSLA